MKRAAASLCLALFLVQPSVCAARVRPDAAADALKTAAKRLVDMIVAGDFSGARETFNEQFKQTLLQERLQESWRDFIAHVGEFRRQVDSQTGRQGGFDVVIVKCEFANSAGYVQVTYDGGGRVTGLWVGPLPPAGPTPQLPPGVTPQEAADAERLKSLAREVVEMMAAENFSGVREKFDEQLKSVLSEAQLRDGWVSLKSGVGNFKRQLDWQYTRGPGVDVVDVLTEFESSRVAVRVTFGPGAKVNSLWVNPVR